MGTTLYLSRQGCIASLEGDIRIYPLSRHTEASILVLGSGQIPVEPPFSTVV